MLCREVLQRMRCDESVLLIECSLDVVNELARALRSRRMKRWGSSFCLWVVFTEE